MVTAVILLVHEVGRGAALVVVIRALITGTSLVTGSGSGRPIPIAVEIAGWQSRGAVGGETYQADQQRAGPHTAKILLKLTAISLESMHFLSFADSLCASPQILVMNSFRWTRASCYKHFSDQIAMPLAGGVPVSSHPVTGL